MCPLYPAVSGRGGAVPTSGDGLVAAVAAGRVLRGVALPTQDALVLGVEGLLGERLVAGGAAEAALVPGAPLVGELLQDPGNGDIMNNY